MSRKTWVPHPGAPNRLREREARTGNRRRDRRLPIPVFWVDLIGLEIKQMRLPLNRD